MTSIIQPFINLLLFRAGPQDIPASHQILKIVLISCFVTDVLGAMGTLGLSMSMLLSAGQLALLSVFVYFLLKLHQKSERWLQTITAVFGALTLINLASLPFIQNLNILAGGQLIITPKLLIVGVLQLWFFIVMARILRDAAEISMGRALLLTFLLVNIIPILLSLFIGALGFEPQAINTISTEAQ